MTPDTKPLDREAHNRRVDALTRLLDAPGWAHVVTRLRRRQAEIVGLVMSEATAPDEVPALRRLHAEIEAIIAIPEADRAISQREIERAGAGFR